jgi:hypothetical protein
MKKHLVVAAIVVLSVCTLAAGTALAAGDAPSGTVTMTSKSVAIGVGVTWGEGTLTYMGKEYKFGVTGLSVIDVGVTSVTVTGEVYNLNKVEDFPGNYASAQAGATLAGGGSLQAMKNQNGVEMRLKSTQQGLRLTLAPEGVKIEMK